MTAPERAAVLGLGLMGGSLARDLAARGVEVLGYDGDADALERAVAEGVVHRALEPGLAGVEEADLLVLGVPVDVAPALLAAAAPRLGARCAVTDLGSTKRSIGQAAARLGVAERFVGSHPLAGDHRAGWQSSRAGLFQGARIYICPTPATDRAVLDAVRALWGTLGGEVVETDAEEHDRLLAWVSHLPQALASALAVALDEGGRAPGELGPGGRDMTRLAASSPDMWRAICLDNADLLEPALAATMDALGQVRAALRRGDGDAVHSFFRRSQRWKLPLEPWQ